MFVFRLFAVLLVLLCLFLLPSPLPAQDHLVIFGGYSYQRVDNSPSLNLNGWELSGQYKFARWLGGVADFDGHYGSPSGGSVSTHNYVFGPQVSWPARVSPFAHVLLGAGHVNVGIASDTSFSTAIGGGIDARLVHGLYWRVIQGDYIHTHFFGTGQNNARVSTGIVFRF